MSSTRTSSSRCWSANEAFGRSLLTGECVPPETPRCPRAASDRSGHLAVRSIDADQVDAGNETRPTALRRHGLAHCTICRLRADPVGFRQLCPIVQRRRARIEQRPGRLASDQEIRGLRCLEARSNGEPKILQKCRTFGCSSELLCSVSPYRAVIPQNTMRSFSTVSARWLMNSRPRCQPATQPCESSATLFVKVSIAFHRKWRSISQP